MKTPVIQRADYTVYFEYHDGNTFIHCDCHRWSKTVRQNLIHDTDVLIGLQDYPVYALHEIGDIKHLKFLERAKFTYLLNVMCTDGKERQVFERKV